MFPRWKPTRKRQLSVTKVYREFITNVNSGAQTITISTGKTNETFVSNEGQTSIVIAENIADPSDPNRLEGRVLTSSGIDVTQDDGRKAVISLSEDLPSTCSIKILIPIFVTNATAKRKIYREDQELIVSGAHALGDIVSLKRTDVLDISQILMGPNGLNVTDNYILDNGQRDNIYDISRLVLKPGRPASTGDLTITYSYFEHDGEGDFFSADSYTQDNGVGFTAIPMYNPLLSFLKV